MPIYDPTTRQGLTATVAVANAEGVGGGILATTRANMSPLAGPDERAAVLVAACRAAGLAPGHEVTPLRGAWPSAEKREWVDVDDEGQATTVLVKGWLTPERMTVLLNRLSGASYVQGAAEVHLTVSTYKAHVRNLHQRFGVASAPELAVAAVASGVIAPDSPDPRARDLYRTLVPTPPEPPARTTRDRRPRVACSADECDRRTTHASGLCPEHR